MCQIAASTKEVIREIADRYINYNSMTLLFTEEGTFHSVLSQRLRTLIAAASSHVTRFVP